MKKLFQDIIIKYYYFVLKMNKVLKFNELLQYKDMKYMKYGVYMMPAAKL